MQSMYTEFSNCLTHYIPKHVSIVSIYALISIGSVGKSSNLNLSKRTSRKNPCIENHNYFITRVYSHSFARGTVYMSLYELCHLIIVQCSKHCNAHQPEYMKRGKLTMFLVLVNKFL